MNPEISPLSWSNPAIPHKIWTEAHGQSTRLCLKVIKDVEPELLMLDLPYEQRLVNDSWGGSALPVGPASDDGTLYSQIRVLLNLPGGCVIWAVTHITLPDGNKMSADRLEFVPNMKADQERLVAR